VSLVRNYRSSFHRIITRNGIDGLLATMRERLANEGEL
jgi:ABC-type transporter MlaC component